MSARCFRESANKVEGLLHETAELSARTARRAVVDTATLLLQRAGTFGEGDTLDSAAVEELKTFAKENPDLRLQPEGQTAISVAFEAIAKVWSHLLLADTMQELAAPDAVAMFAEQTHFELAPDRCAACEADAHVANIVERMRKEDEDDEVDGTSSCIVGAWELVDSSRVRRRCSVARRLHACQRKAQETVDDAVEHVKSLSLKELDVAVATGLSERLCQRTSAPTPPWRRCDRTRCGRK